MDDWSSFNRCINYPSYFLQYTTKHIGTNMITYKQIIVILLIFSIASTALLVKKTNQEPKTIYTEKVVYKDKVVYREPKGIISSITMTDLSQHLTATYRHLSKSQRELILTSIATTSDRYKVSPIVIYGLIAVESSFRFWITHKQVTIKGKKDNGIGLGGIMPSWWLDKLKKAGILETKSDLYEPATNIKAIGFILAEYKTLPLMKGTNDTTTSALRRYFGGNYRSYTNKIENQIGAIIFTKIYK